MNGPDAHAAADEVHGLWRELSELLVELDRRRRDALDLGRQLRRHKLLAVAGGALLVGLYALLFRRRRPIVVVVRPRPRLLLGR